jgi:ABC-2 type transport system permease protein
MFAIYKRELIKFFSSAIGYLVLGIFLLGNGLFLWFLDGNFNILNSGYANLENFFNITPWFFIFVIPALTMGMISEEKRQGTLELLLTHPIRESKIFNAKFYATITLIVLALIPTFLYVITLNQLSLPTGNIDISAISASYVGLLLIALVFSAIGMFSSTISNNQITSFIVGVLLSALFYFSFEFISQLDFLSSISYGIEQLGIIKRYANISRGVLDFKDLIYLLSLTVFFSQMAIVNLRKIKCNADEVKIEYKKLGKLIAILIVANVSASSFTTRIDFTADKRFTLNAESISIVENIDSNINIHVLLTGDLPTGFKQLEAEVKRTLADFESYNSNISFNFIDPFEGQNTKQRNETTQQLNASGLLPINLEVNKNGERKSKYIFPWAIVKQGNKVVKVNLLKNKIGVSAEKQLNNSIENIEYALIDAIHKIQQKTKPRVAILKGHGELDDAYLTDFLKSEREYYQFERLKLNGNTSVFELEKKVNELDAIIIIKPSSKFSEKEKLLLDQFVMNGGKTMWLLDGVYADMDSLMRDGKMLAFPRDLGLTDMLFKYGFRVNGDIVKDLQFSPIKLASGKVGNNVQYHTLPWPYYPLSIPTSKHPIVKNIEAVKFQFASSIDTIWSPKLKKYILLQTSKSSHIFGVPNFIELSEVSNPLDERKYKSGKQTLGLLLEGEFNSAYENKILPYSPRKYKRTSISNKMIVYSDGDLIANQFQNGEALPLGYDKWFNKQYGNKELLENSLSYLLDDSGILNIKKKEITLRLLDKKMVKKEKTFWQLINIILPLIILAVFGFIFTFYRRKKYLN